MVYTNFNTAKRILKYLGVYPYIFAKNSILNLSIVNHLEIFTYLIKSFCYFLLFTLHVKEKTVKITCLSNT